VAVVFDVSAPTFRDNLFAAYKAQRPPMPPDLSLQLPFVRRYCAAMRLPILEYPGYEADDVIGALARQAAGEDLDVVIVTSDKDMLQLVGGRVRVLNPAKNDLVIDEKKVEEILGVPPEKVADVMALMGDTIDNIPGARDPHEKPEPGGRRKAGIGEVGARQLIQQFGSAEEAVARAGEVKRAGYREALEKYGDFVRLSKQLARIHTDAPVALDLDALKLQEPDVAALRELYVELGFTSLLRDFAPVAEGRAADYAPLDSPAALRKFLASVALGQETALWLALDSEEPDEQGFGTRVLGVEVSAKAGTARTASNDPENSALAAINDWLADPQRPKVMHDPKLVHLLAAPDSAAGMKPLAGVRHATHAVASRQPIPPVTTDTRAPQPCATRPASSSPSCGPPMKKIMVRLVMRPRIESGVLSWRMTLRITVLTVSVAPVSARHRKVSQKLRDRPNTMVAAPKPSTAHSSVVPRRSM
jgi:5'-3' exonuclease